MQQPLYFFRLLQIFLELVGRVAGEVGDDAVGIIQIEHLKDGVGSLAVLTLHDGVLDAHFLGSHIMEITTEYILCHILRIGCIIRTVLGKFTFNQITMIRFR